MTLEEGAKALVELVVNAEPDQREAQALQALRGAQLAAYREIAMAARFHAGPLGKGIDGLADGLARAIDSMEHAD